MIRPGRKQTNWQPHGYQGFGFFIHGLWSGSPPDTRGRSPVRKSRTPGSVRGVSGNGYPYRDMILCDLHIYHITYPFPAVQIRKLQFPDLRWNTAGSVLIMQH